MSGDGSAPAGRSASDITAPPLSGSSDLVVSLDSERVWGLVNPGDMVTVTVDGVQMGAARADAVGFFWTTLYDSSGQTPNLSAGDALAVYADGTMVASTTLYTVAGEVDSLADEVTGAISGLSLGAEVTAYIDNVEPTMASYSQTTTTSDALGNFAISFDRFLNCDEPVTLAYVDGGIEVHKTVYGDRLCVLKPPISRAIGHVAPGVVVTVTSYESDGTTQADQAVVATDPDTGRYNLSLNMDDNYVIVTEVEGGEVFSRTADTLEFAFDTANDRVIGYTEPSAALRCQTGNLTPVGYETVRMTTTADASGVFTCDMAGEADLLPGRWFGVYIADDEGDDLVRWAPAQGSVEVNQTWDEVYGFAMAPPGGMASGRAVTLTLNGDVFVSSMEWYGRYYFGPNDGLPEDVDIVPGDVITVEAQGYGWQGVVEVMTMTADFDTANDRFTGEVETPSDRVEVWARQWHPWSTDQQLFPVGESVDVLVTANSPYTAPLPGFDLRNGVDYWVGHRTPGEYLELVSGWTYQIRVWPDYNGVSGELPGGPYTITLRDGSGVFKAVLTGTDFPGFRQFWDVDAELAWGDQVQVEVAGGFDQTVEVPYMEVVVDRFAETVSGAAPSNALLSVEVFDEGTGFVPTNADGEFVVAVDQLQETWGDGALVWGDNARVCYANEDGNLVCVGYSWPQIVANYAMDGYSQVWGSSAIPGNQILITVTDEYDMIIATGTTQAGTGWQGPTSYQLDLPDGAIQPGYTVTVDFGDDLVDSMMVAEITAYPDIATEVVTGTAPANSFLHINVDCWEGGCNNQINNVAVDASGVFTADFNTVGHDIDYGDNFNIHYDHGRGHQTQYSFWVPMPELQVEKQHTHGYAQPGGTYIYQVRYWNNGNGDAENTIITDDLPANTSYFADTSDFTVIDGGSVITWELGTVPPNSYGEFYVALLVDSGVETGNNIGGNCVYIDTTSPGDPYAGNNWWCAGGVWVDAGEVGVSVDKWPNPNDPHPGEEFSYEINYWSDGGTASGPVWLTDTLPVSTTFVRWDEEWNWDALWTEVVTTGGQFVLYAPAGIPGDMGGRIRLTLKLDENAPIGMQLTNHVVVATPQDDYPDNNEDTDTDARVSGARYDFWVEKWSNGGNQTPGGEMHYGISYRNEGNLAAHVWLTDTLPDNTSYQPGSAGWCDWGGCTPFDPVTVTENYVVWDLGMMAVNDGVYFDYAIDIDGEAPTGTITNCATIGGAFADDTPDDNTACVLDTVYPSGPNLRVTKEHQWNGDGQLNYLIHVQNLGDETVHNILVTDTYPLSTTFSGDWWEDDWHPFQVWFTDNYTDGQLLWELEYLEPGWGFNVQFNVDLDEPGTPVRWYTNTIEVTEPDGDPNLDDNSYTDVAFSGGEVERVELNVYEYDLWGCAHSGPVTVTTPHETRTYGDNCWGDGFNDPFMPGDTITVTAGEGLLPVVLTIPDPFDVDASSITDTVWGQIDHIAEETVYANVYDYMTREGTSDGSGNFSVAFPDIPRGAEGHVEYRTVFNYADVTFYRRFKTPDLVVNVDYDHDYVNGNYEAGHTVWLTLTDSVEALKATTVLTTGPIPWWGGQSGFESQGEDWSPQDPDIQIGDWVFGLVNSQVYTTAVRVGEIDAAVDVDADTVSGTIHAPWVEGVVTVNCEIHEDDSQGGVQVYNVDPDGGAFFCDFSGGDSAYDIVPGTNVAVNYVEPDNDRVQAHPDNPAPYLRIEKESNGTPGEGGNISFRIRYRNGGGLAAENVVITDTLVGMSYLFDTSPFAVMTATVPGGEQVVLYLGTVDPSEDWQEITLYARVDASQGADVSNTAEIATSNPFDQGEPWEKISEWSQTVQPNATNLWVNKNTWTWNPAVGQNFVYQLEACNGGENNTSSSWTTLTDTLPVSTTLVNWWADDPGWIAVDSGGQLLVLQRPTIDSHQCSYVYVEVSLDTGEPGQELCNWAYINSPDNDAGEQSAEFCHNIDQENVNLYINKWWAGGQLVPGGTFYFHGDLHNQGNVPVSDVTITETVPVSTELTSVWAYDYNWNFIEEITPTFVAPDQYVWTVDTLSNGMTINYQMEFAIDPEAEPGTELVNTIAVSPSPDEGNLEDNVDVETEMVYDHGPNLRVRKEGRWHDWGPDTSQMEYNINIENVGDERVDNVYFMDTYPEGFNMNSDVDFGYGGWWNWDNDPDGGFFTVTLEALNPGDGVGFNVTFITDTLPLPYGLIFTNTAKVFPTDPYPENNTAVAVLATGPNLWVEKELVAGDVLPGEVVTFSLAFGNAADVGYWSLQGNAWLTDTLPTGMTFITSTQRWCGFMDWCSVTPIEDGDDLMWELWPMGAGNWNEIYLTVQITDTVTGLDTLTNWLEIASGEPVSDTEPYYDDNVAFIDVDVALPYFEVDKEYESSRVAGTPVTYTLTVTNTGHGAGTNVVLSDTLPSELVHDTGSVSWTIPTIDGGGGVATRWFSATLPCTTGTVTNDDYRVTGSDESVTSMVGSPVALTVIEPTFSGTFDQSATTIDAGDSVAFTSTLTSDGTGIVGWMWDFGDGETGTGAMISHTYDDAGDYTVTLTVTDTCGYSDSYSEIDAVTVSGYTIYLPLVLKNSP